jgi:hypothetical protein
MDLQVNIFEIVGRLYAENQALRAQIEALSKALQQAAAQPPPTNGNGQPVKADAKPEPVGVGSE